MSFKTHIQKEMRAAFLEMAAKFQPTIVNKIDLCQLVTVTRNWTMMTPTMAKSFQCNWILDSEDQDTPFPNIVLTPFGLLCNVIKDELGLKYLRYNTEDHLANINDPNVTHDFIDGVVSDAKGSTFTGNFIKFCTIQGGDANQVLTKWDDQFWNNTIGNSPNAIYHEFHKLDNVTYSLADLTILVNHFFGIDHILVDSMIKSTATTGEQWLQETVSLIQDMSKAATMAQLSARDLFS